MLKIMTFQCIAEKFKSENRMRFLEWNLVPTRDVPASVPALQ
jgi:hypothetical protein